MIRWVLLEAPLPLLLAVLLVVGLALAAVLLPLLELAKAALS